MHTHLCVFGRCPGNKVLWITTSPVIAKVLYLETIGDRSDPQGICGSMDYIPVIQGVDAAVTVHVGVALPFPAAIFAFDDFGDEPFFKTRHARACVQVFRTAAYSIVASLQHPITPRDWPHPEFVSQSVHAI
jgi:hypothetical protein